MRHRSEVLLGAAAFLLLAIALVGFVGSAVASRFDGHRWNLPSRIYSDVTVLEPGSPGSADRLTAKLERLFYQAVPGSPDTPGHYHREGDTIDVSTRDFLYPGREFHGYRARVEFDGNIVRSVRDDKGDPLPALVVEPERLGSVFSDDYEDRTLVRLNEVPRTLLDAILVTEDRDFYRHSGVSIKRTFGAIFATARGGAVQGGSTLTQQLVKNLYLTPERTVRRKAAEAAIAVLLEARYSKDEILEAYVNEIYLGQRGAVNLIGVGAAAYALFGKAPELLTLDEAALIAGLIQSPGTYCPVEHPQAALERRNWVLERMAEDGFLTAAVADAAQLRPIELDPRALVPSGQAGHFVEAVAAEAERRFGLETLADRGYRLYATLDLEEQRLATAAIEESLREATPAAPLEAALVSLDPRDGAIRTWIGGRDFAASQFDRVTQARRQAGSVFKPFVFAAALQGGANPADLVNDTPIVVRTEASEWRPRNNDGSFHGPVTVREAIESSLNIPTVRLAFDAGLANVAELARAAGLAVDHAASPSLALGTIEASPLELAAAYGTLAQGGTWREPHVLERVTDGDDNDIPPTAPLAARRALDPDVAYLVTSMLSGVLDRGTGAGARRLGLHDHLAGKTGTTDDRRDSWFAGYSPDRVAVVWVGRDDNKPTRLSGSKGALPVWARFMLAVRPPAGYPEFQASPGVVEVEIDPTTGQLAGPNCPQRRRELFLVARVPSATCAALHVGPGWPLLTITTLPPQQQPEEILSLQNGATAPGGPSHIIIRRAAPPSEAMLRRVDLSRSALAGADGRQ